MIIIMILAGLVVLGITVTIYPSVPAPVVTGWLFISIAVMVVFLMHVCNQLISAVVSRVSKRRG